MRSARAAALALFVVACTREHAVPVRLVVPPATGSLSYELWVLGADDACPSVEQLASAGPTTTVLAQVAFAGDRGPALGRLDVDRARFVVLGRDASCVPVLSACEALTIDEAGVTITLAPYAWTGADVCGATRSCVAGACASEDTDGGEATTDGGPDGGNDGGARDAGVLVCPSPMGGDAGVPGGAFDFTRIEMGSGLESYPGAPTPERNAVDVELRDLDGDDDLDVTIIDHHGVWPHGNGASRVYRNDGARVFADVTDDVFSRFLPTPGTVDPNSAWSALWVTLDGDARLDLFAGSANETDGALFRDTAASGLPEVAQLPLFPSAGALQGDSAAVADVNGDGWLDVLLAHGGDRPRLFLNGGATDGVWVDASATWLPASAPLYSGFRPILADFDGDGDPDLLIQQQLEGARTTPEQWSGITLGTHYLENVGGAFEERTEASGVAALHADGALAVGDFDNDGDLDLVQVGKPAEFTTTAVHVLMAVNEVRVLRNDGGTFTDVSAGAFPVDPPILYDVFASNEQAATGDFDNDGLLDVVMIRDRPMIWENLGPPGIRFNLAQDYADVESHRRVAVGDLDADGDVDFAATQIHTGLGVRLFENQRGGAGALRIVLRDASSPNPFGVGARVAVYAVEAGARGRLIASRAVIASTDQHADYIQHVALPSDGCYEVEVRWPHVDGAADRVESAVVAREPFAQTLTFPR